MLNVTPGAGTSAAATATSPEVYLELYGPLTIHLETRRLKVSGRAATLLVYLALEGQPLHRTAAARLLWPTAGRAGLQNLRVELSVLRRQGLDLSPQRSPYLRLRATTSLDRDLPTPPRPEALQGVNDHGNPLLRDWLTRQRQRLNEPQAAPPGPTPPAPTTDQTSEPLAWLAAQLRAQVQASVHASRDAQLLVLQGRQASGRREGLHLLLGQLGVTSLDITARPGADDLLSALLLCLSAQLDGHARREAERLLDAPGPPETRLPRLGRLLLNLPAPLAVVMRDAARLSREAMTVVDFLLDLPHPPLIVLITTPAGTQDLEVLLSAHDRPGHLHFLTVPPLAPQALPGAAPRFTPEELDRRLEVLRQSEGWLAAASSAELQGPLPVRARLNDNLKRALRAEVTVTGLPLHDLQRLAALPGPFEDAAALDLLTAHGVDAARARNLLKSALRSGVLERVAGRMHLHGLGGSVRVPDGQYPLAFTSELQRAALAASLDARERADLRERPGHALDEPFLVGQPLTAQAVAAPASLDGAWHTQRLPGGFQLLGSVTGEGFALLRLGAPGHAAPGLCLHLPAPAGVTHWTFEWRSAPLPGPPGGHAGAPLHVLHSAGGAGQALSVRPWTTPPPPGGWWRVSGPLTGAALGLFFQAPDLAVQVRRVAFHTGVPPA